MIERDEWLAWRRLGIGGSDIAAVIGLSPWGTPATVYLDKVGLLDDDEGTEAMRWGQMLEGVIADEFGARTGLQVTAAQMMCVDPDHPVARCTLDGLVTEHVGDLARPDVVNAATELAELVSLAGGLEIKVTSGGDWGELPDHVELQSQWNAGVARLERIWVAVLHKGTRLKIHEVVADGALYADLVEIAEKFWADHVEPRRPPPADGLSVTSQAIRSAYPDTAVEAVELTDPGVLAALAFLPSAKAEAKAASAHVDELENVVKLALGDAEAGLVDGVVAVTWKAHKKAGYWVAPSTQRRLLPKPLSKGSANGN